MKKNHDITEVQCLLKHETEKAYLVRSDFDEDVWLPKSQVQLDDGDVGSMATFQMPEWLAVDKKLI